MAMGLTAHGMGLRPIFGPRAHWPGGPWAQAQTWWRKLWLGRRPSHKIGLLCWACALGPKGPRVCGPSGHIYLWPKAKDTPFGRKFLWNLYRLRLANIYFTKLFHFLFSFGPRLNLNLWPGVLLCFLLISNHLLCFFLLLSKVLL